VDHQQRLLSYLHREECNILLKVGEAKAVTLEIEAQSDQSQAGDYEKYTVTALGKLKEAQKYRNFVTVLKEIQSAERHATVNIVQV